ncbi:DnaJ domain-containing protein [Lederbergia sp. NSJ-179]|uniref:DnaJ domain-containing protein n=1 Tax=Lederbergia sp. NSJ-179 TaxID=2931402 RepID=UPI001FD2D3FC|nr:DnaJ domain-containing protein [Lederbergia sp. NSJ-179]MCJ7843532.1 DnaJ domain-containing protein [Lederbergia sp. NSJ-179]
MSGQEVENYYKILGTTAKIGQGRIKEKYIEAVKKYPPESDPEMFEQIRKAYETLKDPVKRKQYDLYRKYGNKTEKLVEKAIAKIEQYQFDEAEKLFQQVLSLAPNIPAFLGLMQLAVLDEDLPTADHYFTEALALTEDTEEQVVLHAIKAKLLAEEEYFEEALQELETAINQYPDSYHLFLQPYVMLLVELEEEDKAFKVITQAISSQEEVSSEQFGLFLTWLHLLNQTEKWEERAKIQRYFRKFIQNITDEEERTGMMNALLEEYEEYSDNDHFQGAELFLECAQILRPNDPEIRKAQQKVKQLAQVQRELFRLEKDQDAFPLLYINAMRWFYGYGEEFAEMLMTDLPQGLIEELEEEKEEYAIGIARLKKRYPAIYRHFKDKWDDLFNELTSGFNREMKRYLRKVK